ncbi:helix-turn-helix domain-containing protein [Nautilia lithotrophica]
MTLGEKIKFFRENKGLNLSELASRAGVAKSTLFKIEENKTNPTINTIWAIAEVLGVPFGELVGEGEVKGEGVSVVLIEKTDEFESYKMNLRSGAEYIAKPHFAGAVERVYVLKGDVKVGSVDNIHPLHAGEILEFEADKTHIYSALTPSILIVTIYYLKFKYFKEDVFVDVFDREVYERLNFYIQSGVEIIRVIAKHDKFDAQNVVKNEHGIFIYGDINVKFDEPLSIREYEKREILKNFSEENVYACYLALIGEVEMARELMEN